MKKQAVPLPLAESGAVEEGDDLRSGAGGVWGEGGGAGAKTGAYLINGYVRKLSPRECARLQGFPENFIIAERNNQAYKQFGNSVAVPVLKAIVNSINNVMGEIMHNNTPIEIKYLVSMLN